MESLKKTILEFARDFLDFPEVIKKRAEAAIKRHLYSPKQDEVDLLRIRGKLEISEKGITDLLVKMMEVGMRLHLFYSKKDISKAASLSLFMANTMRDTLKRATMRPPFRLELTEREKSRVLVYAEYWQSAQSIDISIKSAKEENALKQNIESNIRNKKYDEAARELLTLLEAKVGTEDRTEEVATLRKIAEVMKKKGDLKEALKNLERAASIDPVVWFDVGYLLSEMKRWEKSIEAYDNFLKKVPESVSAWHNKGFAFENMKNFPEALKCYEKALNFNKSFLSSLLAKGWILKGQGRAEQAIMVFKEALNVDPANQDALIALTGLYNDGLCDYEKSLYYANKALKVNPRNIDARTNLAEGLVLVGRYKEARDHAKKALQLAEEPSQKLAMHFTIASSYFLEGKAEEATEILEDLMDYRASLPPTFTGKWGYNGISNLITKSSIKEDYRAKLLETIKAIS